MKANGATEKIYLSKNIYSTYLYQVPDPDDETAVEYIRTDAFIEKAKKWFEENFKDFMNVHKWEVSTYEFENTQSMIDEFRKYMEGE